MRCSRRELLRRGAVALVLSGCGSFLSSARRERDEDPASRVFPNSVASGDPTATGAIVWTRLAPEALVAGQDLVLEVANDPEFREVIVSEGIRASRIGPDQDFVVREDLDGRLAPNQRFFYRFVYGRVSSRTGRLRTLPAAAETPGRLRLALASCQDYTRGFFNAYDDIAREELDFILHVGDFLYESIVPERSLPGRRLELPSGERVARNVEDFRAIHRAYRSDPALQRALERHTLIAVWDDHDVANDRYWDPVAMRLRAPDHPLDLDVEAAEAMHAGGIRAWWEYLPVRVAYDSASASLRDRIRVERSFRFGRLAELFVTDNRLRRDPHPCGEQEPGARFFRMDATCPERTAAARSMLGEKQRRWIVDRLASSDARWKLWGTSVPLTPVGYGSGPGRLFLTLDTWAGYAHERRSILGELATRGVENLVSLTGDMHTFFAAGLHVDEVDPLRDSERAVGVEFATGPLSATRLGDILALITHPDVVHANNPQIAFWNAVANGYALVEITADETRYEPRGFAVDRPLTGVEAAVLGRFRVQAGASRVVSV